MASIANTDNKQGRFDCIKFSEGCRFGIKYYIAHSIGYSILGVCIGRWCIYRKVLYKVLNMYHMGYMVFNKVYKVFRVYSTRFSVFCINLFKACRMGKGILQGSL